MIPDYITPGAIVRLRDGSKARIYATDGGAPWNVHGALWTPSAWISADWADACYTTEEHELDIVGPWVDEPDAGKLWPLLPPWIKWVAVDKYPSACDGWHGYSEKPRRNDHCEIWDGRDPIRIPPTCAPTFTGDWKDSLCERPKP